ncbi:MULTISPECIES: SAM-dependent methyltransferase [Rheinheimera]|uniref:SAM-dependent methyltransferase n=1 Tax=Rheinheimera marina TaxID=1774958 RepID=A0ABV9JIE4_9GAMM
MRSEGQLFCIGLGIMLGSQLTELARARLAAADLVFFHSNSHYLTGFLQKINPNLVDLQPFYQPGQSRLDSYEAMITAVMAAVQQGKQVVWACYGHPGVASWPPHEVIRRLTALGYRATMEAGISADACLYADLGIDPMAQGCAQFEASQFLFYRRTVDTSAYLILWQAAIAGDFSLKRLEQNQTGTLALQQRLLQIYPADHQVLLYEAADLPIWQPRIESIVLKDLDKALLNQITTLVVPPACDKTPDVQMLDLLGVPAGHPLRLA